jgi:hypothetical protein
VVPAGADWVHPAQNTSAAARRPRIYNFQIDDIFITSVPQENRGYGNFDLIELAIESNPAASSPAGQHC